MVIGEVKTGAALWVGNERYYVTDKGERVAVVVPWPEPLTEPPFGPPYVGGEIVADEYVLETATLEEPKRL